MSNRMFVRFLLSLMVLTATATAGVIFDSPPDGFNSYLSTLQISGIDPLTGINNSASNLFSPSYDNVGALRVSFNAWMFPTDLISTVDWSIGSSPFGNEIASGTNATVYNTLTTNKGYDIVNASFIVPDAPLFATNTYYLTLQNATETIGFGLPVFWDEVGAGPPTAFANSVVPTDIFGNPVPEFTANSFQIQDAPEPGTLILLGAGMVLVGAFRRRHIRP